jgi:hypothetical protein
MKLISLLTLGLVLGKSVNQPITATEDDELVRSVDELIGKYLADQQNAPIEGRMLDTMEDSFAPRIEPIAKIGTEQDAKSFVKYAGASYCDSKSILNWSCANCEGNSVKPNDVEYFTDDETKTAGLLAVDTSKKLIVLSYRGSSNLSNWLFNLDISVTNANLKYPYDDAKIHNGFNNMANALYDKSRNALDRALKNYPDFKVVFTGHSLGGALAGLTAFKLAENGLLYWGRISVITYGQPRIGNISFAQYLNSKPWTYTRVTSYGDLVAISPGISIGYGHNQFNMHINKSGKTIQCNHLEEDNKCINDHYFPSSSAHFNFWNMKMNTKC